MNITFLFEDKSKFYFIYEPNIILKLIPHFI